jgi:hypothetical protein
MLRIWKEIQMATSAERERIIRAAWDERGSKLWKSEIHGRGLATLEIQASVDMKPIRPGQPLPHPDLLEFRLVRGTMNGYPIDSVVCENVVVAMLP